MATRAAQMTINDHGVLNVLWEGITEADDGAAISAVEWPDKTVQAFGDFDASGAITMQGSPDGTTWATLTDPLGVAIVLTDSTPMVIAQNTKYIRPAASAGTAVDMDVLVTGAK